MTRCKTGPVQDAGIEQLCSLIQFILKTLLSHFEYICNVRHVQKILHVVEAVGLHICIRQLSVDLRLTESLAGHLEEADKIVVLASMVRDLNDFREVRWILCLDVRIYTGQNNCQYT